MKDLTNYRDALRALATSIEDDEKELTSEQKTTLARKILNEHGLSVEAGSVDFGIESVEITLSEDAKDVLKNYLAEIQRARDAEIGKNVQNSLENARRLKSLREELKNDLSKAYDEDQELERIAERLQDSELGKIAGKEEHQINELGRKLEALNEKAEAVERLDEALETILEEQSIDLENLEDELHERASRVSTMLSEASLSSDSSSEDEGPYGGKYGRPTPDEPWIISVSDVESRYGYMKEALSLLERHGWSSMVSESGGALQWSGGDRYRFILNGDLLDRGSDPEGVWRSVFNLLSSGRGEMTMGNHDLPILVPKTLIPLRQSLHSRSVGEGLPDFPSSESYFQELLDDAIDGKFERDFSMKRGFAEAALNGKIKMIAKGHNYFYVHGGARHVSRKKMQQANKDFRRMVAGPIMEDIGKNSRSNEREIRDKIRNNEGKYQMLFGGGKRSGRDVTAGLTWMSWENVPEDAGNMIVGHTGVPRPEARNGGQVINGNTAAGSGTPSIIVETPDGVFALMEGEDEPIDLVGY